MSGPAIRGWCPGALRPMASGDGLVVRLRPHLGRLSQEQAAGVADLSRRHGSGRMDLSSRANLQLRGIGEGDHGDLVEGLRSLDLVDDTAEAEARRNITVTPFHQPEDDSAVLARALTKALGQSRLALPGKFGFAVDCGADPVLSATPADIRIERAKSGLTVRADGVAEGAEVTVDQAVARALDLAAWFLASGGAPAGRGRMARHLASGPALPPRFTGTPARPGAPRPLPGRVPGGWLCGLAFGEITADQLEALARLGALRLTPWRMVLVEGRARPVDLPGILDTDDPLLRVLACRGAPDCPQGLTATRPLATALAANVPADQVLHVAGCAKGCAHPRPADLTLVATGPGRFSLVTGGGPGDTPDRTDLLADTLIRDPDSLTGPA